MQTDNLKIWFTIHRTSYKLLTIPIRVEAPYPITDQNVLSQPFIANTPQPKLDYNSIIRFFVSKTLQELFYCWTPYCKNDYMKFESLFTHQGQNSENIV